MTDLNGSRGMRLITGNSNKPLVAAISSYLGLTPVKADVRRFSDDEVFVEVHENVRGEDMFLIQSTSAKDDKDTRSGKRTASQSRKPRKNNRQPDPSKRPCKSP